MKKSLKIAIVHPKMTILGGAEVVILNMAKLWIKEGHHVDIISAGFSKEVKTQLNRNHCKTISIKTPFIPGYDTARRNLWIMGLRIRPLLKNYDIINCHNFPANIWLSYASKGERKNIPPVIWSCHEPPRSLYEEELNNGLVNLEFDPALDNPLIIAKNARHKKDNRQQWLIKKDNDAVNTLISEVIANSQFTAKNVKKIYGRDAISQHFPGNILKNKKKENQEKPLTNQKQILIISRLEKLKNLHIVIKAIKELKIKYKLKPKDFVVNIIGTGELDEKLKIFAKNQDVLSFINFKGFLSNDKLDLLYKSAYFVISVSRVEPLGLIPIEAASYSLPTIAAKEGGSLETIVPQNTGDLIDPNSSQELAEKIYEYLQNPKHVESLGKKAFLHHQKQDPSHSLINCFNKLFEKLLPFQ
ncbi:hypothetical protein DID78_00425 [Candidatus Marinamargulisbacteria bacterium SCGC AG-343-D04]|nr:hypothetical protein DID78_00425 [Candidatus Marinamargulisbacteria bacterium SCGC AG-343-D04]